MSGSFLGSGILHYVQSNFDFMVVGRRFGAEQLGYYQTAYSVPDELRNRLSGPLQRVLFPAYSLLQQDLIAFRDAVGRSQKMLAAVLLPIGAGLAVVAEEFVGVVYGARWAPVVPLLQVLAVGGALRATFSLVASIFYATGRPDLALKINLVSAPFVLGAILAGSEWGVIGVAWAMVLVMLPSFVSAHIAMKLIGGSLVTFLDAQWTPALGTLCMVLSLIVGKGLLSLSDSVAVALVLQIVVGGVIYLTTLVLIDRAFVKEGLAICASVLARKR
jgi:PST family polysaccharide transporter